MSKLTYRIIVAIAFIIGAFFVKEPAWREFFIVGLGVGFWFILSDIIGAISSQK